MIKVGDQYGHLTVIERIGVRSRYSLWLCRCVCGNTVERNAKHLSRQTNCGCLSDAKRKSSLTTHGGRRTSEYVIWQSMKQRCLDHNHRSYRYYGAMGVQVCQRWINDFSAFIADVGPRPSASHSLDRYPNNDGNYEPGNVRWATYVEQRHNRRDVTRANQ